MERNVLQLIRHNIEALKIALVWVEDVMNERDELKQELKDESLDRVQEFKRAWGGKQESKNESLERMEEIRRAYEKESNWSGKEENKDGHKGDDREDKESV